MSMPVHLVAGPLDDERRSTLVFGGALLLFGSISALAAFRTLTDTAIRDALGDDPEHAQHRLEPDDFRGRVSRMQREYRRDKTLYEAFRAAMSEVGVDVADAYWDWLYLRIQPHADRSPGGTLGVHRDTWSSNVYAQTNWWTPIYPISEERTVAFHPAHWTRPVANTSAGWDLDKPDGRPLVPEPSEVVDAEGAVPVVIEPGDLLCFSGAHLHASVPNTSGVTRFSVEVRTVHGADVRAGRGAPNIDGAAPRVAWRWFHRLTDGASLTDLAAEIS